MITLIDCVYGYLRSIGDDLEKEVWLGALKESQCLFRPQGYGGVNWMARSEIQLQTVWRGKLGPERQIENG